MTRTEQLAERLEVIRKNLKAFTYRGCVSAGSLRRHIDLDGDAVRVDDEELVQRPSRHFRLAKIDSRLLQSASRALEIRGRERNVIEAAGSFRSLIAAADEMHDRASSHIEPRAGKVE